MNTSRADLAPAEDSPGQLHLELLPTVRHRCLPPGSPGRTTGGEDFDSLMGDLQAKVFDRLPDDTWFYPGHGNDSTLGTERPAIPEWLARRW